jgi:hypothetical protein
VAVANLEDDAAVQLMLPFDRRNDGALDAAVDEVQGPLRVGVADASRPSGARRGDLHAHAAGLTRTFRQESA